MPEQHYMDRLRTLEAAGRRVELHLPLGSGSSTDVAARASRIRADQADGRDDHVACVFNKPGKDGVIVERYTVTAAEAQVLKGLGIKVVTNPQCET